MSEFDAIRPYNDSEVPGVLARLINDSEFLDAIIKLKFSKAVSVFSFALRGVVKKKLKAQTANISTVADFQSQIESYFDKVIDDTVTNLTVSGLDKLDSDQSYLFISNHRDIAMDPAFVNLALYRAGFSTLRIAIGDNLLTKPFASDLMRLNKSFIVNRSAKAPREKFKAAKLLSKYIRHSVLEDGENVWIAQREGRAKDGIDKTNSAIISMLSLSKPKTQNLSDYVQESRVIPVSISYEYDPCDADKARELYLKSTQGTYEKQEHEDVQSIARGITGIKGRVHLTFGDALNGEFENSEDVTQALDQAILNNYQLHLSNCFAYEILEGKSPILPAGAEQTPFCDLSVDTERAQFKRRVAAIDSAHRPIFLEGYANPVKGKLGELN